MPKYVYTSAVNNSDILDTWELIKNSREWSQLWHIYRIQCTTAVSNNILKEYLMPLKYVINMLLRQVIKEFVKYVSRYFLKNKYINRKHNLEVSIQKCQQWLSLDGEITDLFCRVFDFIIEKVIKNKTFTKISFVWLKI